MKSQSNIVAELRKSTTAVRLSFSWLGTRKTLNADQRRKAAETFQADKNYLSASQKLFDTRHPAFAKLTNLKGDITNYWKFCTLPYSEDGIRLINKAKIEDFTKKMHEFQEQFSWAVDGLEKCLAELKADAAKRLGDLYHASNYPESVKGHFSFEWSFPSIEPPAYLEKLAPNVYQQEQDKIQSRLLEAVALAETAFMNEFKELVEALHERLTPGEDGQKKVFRDSAIGNLATFFNRFKDLHLGSNEELEKLVEDAQGLVKGITAKELRDNTLLRATIAADIGSLKDKLAPLVTIQPRRKIIKPTQVKEPNNGSPQAASQEAIAA